MATIHTESQEAEKQAFLSAFARSRGYVHPFHHVLAEYDLPVLKLIDAVGLAMYVEQRNLSARTKEILVVAGFVALNAQTPLVQSHISKAFRLGVTLEEMVDVMLVVGWQAGQAAFLRAMSALRGVQPRNGDVLPAFSGRAIPSAAIQNGHFPMAYPDLDDLIDPNTRAALDALRHSVYDAPRALDARTKALLSAVILTVLKAPTSQISDEVRRAIDGGYEPREILEGLELLISPAGHSCFQHGLMAWAEAIGAGNEEASS
ncbi:MULTISPECIES: carboxymuconolactone decarboxylase family protein [unclassified Chelatococcus]|uniref:carboxymuconolactone decarboxylase family protein n=1 Tax=unclassified Chelatococcus TaxID=2638111 RepID=UPI001BD0080D|nr:MULTISPECIES: carboxymuconolactone decarboxylase family protein [unclassified Chelatococcus]MBS7697449.1 carboxymuconolactone decarboxylase family protein [Chelatococcus sp. YT9]MBX3559240.1 carboxymuconolactone decarboxylase family protein [Chelatococcus sp.]